MSGTVTGPWGAAPREDEPVATADAAGAPAPSQYPCPGCGAILAYAPGETSLVCAFCGARSEIPRAGAARRAEAIRERDFRAALEGLAEAAPSETTQVVHCDACGANVEFDPNEHAAECPFCATPVVAATAPDRHIKPQAVLPFAIREEEVRARLKRWLSSLWFAPNALKRYARSGGRMQGIYVPYWTFDAQADAAFSGQRGDVYMVKRGKRAEMRVRWRPVSGRIRRGFDDVVSLGSTSLPRAYTDALEPWDLGNLEPYSRDWLAGFRAEAYTVGLEEGFGAAQERMRAALEAEARARIGGDRQRLQRLDARFDAVTFKHVLLPVWVGAYRFRGAVYRVVVNGRTGRVKGERPWSAWKIALAVLAALAVAGAVLALGAADGRLRF